MTSFSEKYGYKSKRTVIQIESIDTPLMNGLWNVVYLKYLENLKSFSFFPQLDRVSSLIIKILWQEIYKIPIDEIPIKCDDILAFIKKKFYEGSFDEIYDFIQFCANISNDTDNSLFKIECNRILERELAGYRFIGNEIAPITSKIEIAEIGKAIATNDPIATHLNTALSLLSDKEIPDYRNSIKESISAVESLCGDIAGKPKATLGDALDVIKKSGVIELHPSLSAAFDKLYGYTSNADGIRHALLEETELKQEDAVFMLTVCSAFVNYLKVKYSRTNK